MDCGRTHIAAGSRCVEWKDHHTQSSVAPKDDPHRLLDSARAHMGARAREEQDHRCLSRGGVLMISRTHTHRLGCRDRGRGRCRRSADKQANYGVRAHGTGACNAESPG